MALRSPEKAQVDVIINDEQAESKLKDLQNRSAQLREEMNKLRKANDKSGFDNLARELKAVEKEEKRLKEMTIEVTKVMNNLNGTSFNELIRTKKKLESEMRQFTDRTSAGYVALKEKVKLLNTEVNRTRAEMNDSLPIFERANNFFNNYSGLIMASVAALAAFVVGLRGIANEIMVFEKSFTNILTNLSKEDAAKYSKQLEKDSIRAMKEYGVAAETVNNSIYDTVSAGISAAEAMKVVDNAAKLAIGGVTDLAVATDGMTSVINAYGLQVSESEQVASAFFAAQTAGKGTVSEISSEIGKVAPIMAMAGMSYQDTLAALAKLTKNGISTAESTTYLKSAISSLINPTAEAKKILEQYGVPFGVTGLKAAGLEKTIEKLNEVIKVNPDILSKAITSTEGLAAVQNLAGKNFEDFQKILKQVNSDFGEGSSLANAYTLQQNTMEQSMNRASEAVHAMAIELKDTLTPFLKGLFTVISETSHLLVKFFKLLNENRQTIAEIGKAIGVARAAILGFKLGIAASNLVTAAARNIALAYAAAQELLAGKIKRAEIATKLFNIATKANPVGLIISILTAAGTAFFMYRDAVKETTAAEKEFNELKEKTAEMLKTTNKVEEDARTMSVMNSRQLENIKNRAQAELDIFEDLNVQKAALLAKYNQQIEVENAYARRVTRNEADYNALLNNKSLRMQSNTILAQLSLVGETQSKYNKFELERIVKTADVKIKYLESVDKVETKKQENKAKQAVKAKEEEDARLKALESLAEETQKMNQRLALEKLTADERALEEIRLKYAESLAIAQEGEARQDELSAGFAARRRELELAMNAELIAKKLEQEATFEDAKKRTRDKYNLTSDEEKETDEQLALMELYAQNLIDNEGYEIARTEIAARYAKKREEIETNSLIKKFEGYKKSLDKMQYATELFGNFFAAAKDAELQAAGDNEEKKKQIQKKYAIPELIIASSKIISETALAVMAAIAASPLTGGMPWAAIIGATGVAQLASVAAQKAKIMGLESGGYFDIERAQDGRRFRASTSNRRGWFSRPTVLVGEYNKPEYVVSSELMKNDWVRNVVDIIDAAKISGQVPAFDYQTTTEAVARVRGFENGGYTQTSNTAMPTPNGVSSEQINTLLAMVMESNAANAAMVRNIKVTNNALDTDAQIQKYKSVENRANI